MAPRNAPLPNAVNIFNCTLCSKGYPRQIDYDNHLRSYDHNHRARLNEMSKLTAAHEGESSRPKKSVIDMRSLPTNDSGKVALGSRFTKIGGTGAAGGGSRFKKVGVAVNDSRSGQTDDATAPAEIIKEAAKSVEPTTTDAIKVAPASTVAPAADHVIIKQAGIPPQDGDLVMVDAEEEEEEDDEVIDWEEYDVTKPTGCDHATCPGCPSTKTEVDEDGWLILGSA
ncbi:unnamed protein product [Periconia digitata]|uniref:C2H2-type domain-containing protein n=1 Tax=Periconia digitata TaxID=1303443 RepID=A0A9W4XYV7_9PLEO|nr:unnamed protein product [Periconia digitata]